MSRYAVPVLTPFEARMLERAAGLCHVAEDLHASPAEWAAFRRAMDKLNRELAPFDRADAPASSEPSDGGAR